MKIGNIPVRDKNRDAAWAAFIKRKDVQAFFANKDDMFRSPLERGWYEVWCQAWHKGWDAGWDAGFKVKGETK